MTSPTAPPAGASGKCDLGGRWLVTLHYVTDAIGQKQVAHTFLYYELEQKGDAFSISRGLQCGDDAIGLGDFAVTASFKASWEASASKVEHKGRKGSSVAAANGCKIDLEKWVTVRGATLPYYLDSSKPLPDAETKAAGMTPGWEDWDNDGNPGITGELSGVVTGKIFVAPRQWTTLSGSVAEVSRSFSLPLQWDQSQNVMAYDGSPLLGTEAARAADPSLHFAEFARLSADQATGDDKATCSAVVKLAASLTPKAAGL